MMIKINYNKKNRNCKMIQIDYNRNMMILRNK